MKLFLLKRVETLDPNNNPWEPWFDKSFGHVVRAEDEESARKIADANSGDENDRHGDSPIHPWLDSSQSTCVELTADGTEESILVDFWSA